MGQVLSDIAEERINQDEKWGQQNHPDGTGALQDKFEADRARNNADYYATMGGLTWRHILREEVYEALAESDPTRLREELIQVAAVAVAWVEAIDRREELKRLATIARSQAREISEEESA